MSAPSRILDRPEYLRERLKALPEGPGVYLMTDIKTRVIYVGKALSLYNRVPSYFHAASVLPLVQLGEEVAVPQLRAEPDAWVFPSERMVTPLSRDNFLRRHIEPKLKAVGLEWVDFQVMRRTHASLSRKFGIDPKVVADQLGHGLGVNLDVYTKSDLEQRALAVTKLESEVMAA